MAETYNISALANKISDDIIKWLKWGECIPHDENWSCVKNENHEKKSHPSDVVFYYNDPYSGKTIYLNTDLKSYAKSSISAGSIQKGLQNLALSIDCANVSDEWKELFLSNEDDFDRVCGLFFLFNHDNEFINKWESIYSQIDFDRIKIPELYQIFVLDPNKIRLLFNVTHDIKALIADDKLPKRSGYTFFYPDLRLSKTHGGEWNQPATIESINSPWLIIKHRSCEKFDEGHLIYYHSPGNSIEEFLYFIDMLSYYQLLINNSPIRIRLTQAESKAKLLFKKAINEYMSIWGPDESKEKRLNSINIETVQTLYPNYKPMEVGIKDHD